MPPEPYCEQGDSAESQWSQPFVVKKPCYGHRDDKRPVSCHDVDFVDGKSQDHMQSHVDGEERQSQPLEPLPSASPDAQNEERDAESLGSVVPPMTVVHEDGAQMVAIGDVAQEIILMELQ